MNYQAFCCPCCKRGTLNHGLVLLLQKIEHLIGKPVVVTSGYRCPRHNVKVKGAKASYHMGRPAGEGISMAVDIYVTDEAMGNDVIRAAKEAGHTGGIEQGANFVHIDLGAERHWSYT